MDELNPSFEQSLELDMRRLAEEVTKRKEVSGTESRGDKDLIKEAIDSMTDGSLVSAAATQAGDDAQAPMTTGTDSRGKTVIKNPLPDYAASAPAETKLEIEYLLELAFKKGILHASNEAAKSSAFVRDAFRDSLAGKLYPILRERGVMK
jgi:hypothetical protein